LETHYLYTNVLRRDNDLILVFVISIIDVVIVVVVVDLLFFLDFFKLPT